ncbi:hypothetical protein QR680_010690 [Steinernema hermaphroditum]|uniref:G-protein coupled receptors family 2 profile 2 domain-containing protein n=1 Tax=Steinernema hermaphroditum TaxID=289476 RepID=A0AA39MBZ3_9BILA|nr:hypothetical protein QR680_010690 [Steinernema hermaphroditum]
MFVLLMLLLLCPHALFVPFYNNMYFAYFDPNNPSNDFYFERTYLPSSNTYLYSPVDPETFPGSVIVTVTTRSSDGHKANIVYILSTTENTTVSVSSAEFVLTKFDSFQLVHSVEDGQNGEMKFKGCNKYSITCGPPSAADCEVQCDDYHICACIEPSCLDVCWTKYGPPKITNPATSPETTTSTPSTTSTSTTQTTPKQSSSATTGTSTSTTFTTTSSVSSSTSSSGTLPHTTTKSFFFSNSTDAPEISYPNADQGLKNLTNETITPYNVRHVLNQSLTYAEMGKDLNADDVTLLSLIVRNASMLSNISHNFYKMLTAVLLYISIVVPLTSTQQLICRGPVYFSYLEFAQPHSSFHLKRVLSAVPPQFTYYDVGPSSFDGTIAVWDDSGNYFSLTKVKDTVVPFQMPANLHTSFENFDLHDNIATDDDDGVTIVDHFQFSKCEAHHAVDNYQLYDCFESRICVSCEHPHQEVCPGFYNNPPATSSIASSTTKSQPTTSSTSIPSTTTSTVTTHSSTVHQTASTAPLNTTDIPFDVPSGLWNLTNTPITSDNVYSILNQSLAYAEMGDELTPDDVSLLSIIVHNASMLPDIQHDHNFIGPLDKQFHSDIAPSVYLQCNILHKDYIIYLNSDHFNSSSTDIVSRCSTRTPKLDTHPDYVPKRTSCAEKSFGFFKNAPGSISRRHHVFVAYCSQDSQSTQYQSFRSVCSVPMRCLLILFLLIPSVTTQKTIWVYYSDSDDMSRNFFYSAAYEESPSHTATYTLGPSWFTDSILVKDSADVDHNLTITQPAVVPAKDGDGTSVIYNKAGKTYFSVIQDVILSENGRISLDLSTDCSNPATKFADGTCYMFVCTGSRFCYLALLSFTPNSAYDGLVNIFYVGQAPSGSEFFVIEIFYDPVNLQLVFQLVGNETILVGAPPEAPNSPAPSPQQLTNENNVTIDYPISGATSLVTTFSSTSTLQTSPEPANFTTSYFLPTATTSDVPPKISYPNAQPSLQNLTNINITSENAPDVLNETLTYSSMGSNLTSDDVTCLSIIVVKAAALPNISHHVATLLLENVDYMQGAALETFAESNQPGKGDGTTQRIVNAVHNMVQNLQDSNFDYMTGQQLGLRAINKDNHDDDLSIGHDGEKFDSKPGDNSVASITIPKAAMDGGGRVYVAYWATNKLFIPKRITYTRSTEQSGQYITSLTHAEKCSQTLTPTGKDPVLTGTILDKSSTNSAKLAQSSKQLQAVITYDKKKALHPLHGEYKVTWWDKYFSQWARDEQCEMVSNTGRIVAHCYHLTDFTLVEDGMQNDPLVCSVPLQAIAYTLNVLSIVSLIVFMTIRATRYLRRVNQEQPSTPLQKILLNKFLQRKNANEPVVEDLMYTLFLFLFYLFFTCFKDQRVTHNGCEAMGGIAYFLFLCIPFQVFVFAIGDVALRLSYKKVGLYASPATALGVSIGLSFVITVGLGAGSDFFKRNDQFCWIRPTYVVPGIVLPLVFIFTTGIMSTACVAWAFFESRNQNNDLNSWQTRKERLLRITRIVQMQLHLGLPWIFQFASLAFPYVTAWHYLFAFTNDSQGIIHLLIFFLFDKLEAVRKDYEENRSEVDAKQVMEQEKNDRDLLENYYHKEETSVKRRTQIEFTSYAETIEEPYYSRPAATSTPVAHQKSVKTTLYDEPPGETYPEILKRISLEDRQRNSRMIELKSMDFSVEDELWDEEDLEQDTADPEQGNDSTTESSKSDGLGADEAFVNDTVDCTNSTNSGGDGDDAGTAEQNVNEPEQDGNSTTESLDSSEVELSEDNPIDYTNSTDSDGSEDENGADDAANDDGTAPEYEVIQTNPSEPEVHSPLKLKAHENAEEELNWLAGRVTDRAKDDGYDVPSKSEPTSTRNLKTESKMEDDGDLTELPQKTIIDRLPSYKPPSPPPLSTMPAITYLPLITTEPPSDDENPNVKRRWKDHLQRQDSIDESDVE